MIMEKEHNFQIFLMYISSTGYHYKQNENKIELFVVNKEFISLHLVK